MGLFGLAGGGSKIESFSILNRCKDLEKVWEPFQICLLVLFIFSSDSKEAI